VTNYESHEIVGMPKYIIKNTSEDFEEFKVNDMLLHCFIDSLFGSDGCQRFKKSVDINRPARATYFFSQLVCGITIKYSIP
jgi:hypothetical protein